MKSLLREPLVHFLLIGAALFIAFGLFNDPVGRQSDRILITSGQIEFLKANFTRTWQRSPTEQELQGLISSHVREEIFYREALALGLDRDDGIIRRRLMQKLEFMSDDLAAVATPSDEQLGTFLETHPESFRIEPQAAFRQVYFNIDQRGNTALDEAGRVLAELSVAGDMTDPDTLGDNLMLPKSLPLSPASEIARMFGESFSIEIMKIEPGQWAGPIRSGYGLHLVLVSEQVDGRLPALDEVRELVEQEWSAVHRKELKEAIYKKFREKYTVVFEQPPAGANPIQVISGVQAAQEVQK
jgi:hypothetical protein